MIVNNFFKLQININQLMISQFHINFILKKQFNPINEKIKASEVMLIGIDGKKMGLVSIEKALEAAKNESLDLV